MKKVLFLACLFVFTIGVPAQSAFQWKSLRFEASSIRDAVSVLGKPHKDKIEKAKLDKSIPADVGAQMSFRKLHYKNIDDYSEVYLLFLNEKLLGIELTPREKKLPATDLGRDYDSDFLFLEGISGKMNFSDYEGQKETTVPKVYPGNYFMLSVKTDCTILAAIDNNSWKAIWRDGIKKPTLEMFPGYVKTIHILSRRFEGK